MEDGANSILCKEEEPVKNGVDDPIMANFPDKEEASIQNNLHNGDSEQVSNPESCSSESDALVIDETAPKKNDIIPHFNPYFNESLFELSQQHTSPQIKLQKNKRFKVKNSPKLREYAQYLGLQPTVQFKCSRCGRAGFESLTTLNEHIIQCTDEPLTEPQVQENSSSSFKLRRKVFLCSACGTYYENWNLYLHMIEVHRRYLCLYCLGMFSVLDDLCLHIQSRHNLEPGYKDSLEDFFSAYSDPCYIVCCECNKLFNEQDNFFYHTCARKDKKIANNQKLKVAKNKPQIRPEDHVTGDSLHQECYVNGDLDSGSVAKNSNRIDSITNEVDCNRQPVSEEIIYSSDDELDFRGFNEKGDPVYKDQLKGFESTQIEDVEEEEEAEIEPELEEAVNMDKIEPVETRKVPKLSLKLKPGSFPEIEQHENSDVEQHEENEQIESETENEINTTEEKSEQIITEPLEQPNVEEGGAEEDEPCDKVNEMQIAGADISIIELELEQPLDKFDIRVLLQKCLKATAPLCIYCNHARKIAVNGKQLGLHAIAEHRFSAVVSSITAEELIPESFVTRIKESLPELDNVFFSLEASTSDEGVTFSHIFECFQCRYSTTVHKELYLHNRKLHAKNLLLCIMCKSNFYSYSELICHLCPGVYVLDNDVEFRCCMCVSDNLPSAFRLMVHLRKRHHVCDVCLEMCHNQYKLSNHVWKHKLHHFCYRCGIAYRNKPDITRHLFWKHGTESVLCKKCLQKKWPHVYHFCVPPTSFICEECNLTFSRAVFLKVHKRIHSDEKPHACTVEGCDEKFISKKLLEKHEIKHREPPPEEKVEVHEPVEVKTVEIQVEEKSEKTEEKVKPKVDVYDLPALNLSESDSSDSEDENAAAKKEIIMETQTIQTDNDVNLEILNDIQEPQEQVVESEEPPAEDNGVVIENIWENFKNYQANKEKFDHLLEDKEKIDQPEEPEPISEQVLTLELALQDHDYCIDPDSKTDVTFTEVKPDLSQSVDHDYCFAKKSEPDPAIQESEKAKIEEAKKDDSSSSDSSSDSDSSSCSCGPNCSCSSSSGSSSSSSDSSNSDSSTEEGRKRQQIRREKRRQKKNNSGKTPPKIDVVGNDPGTISLETPIVESDLETTESETDEEFYDKQPQIFAKKILEEKRNQLLAGIDQANGSLESRVSTPNLPDEEVKPKKKSKSKKKKKKKSERKSALESKQFENIPAAPYYQYYQPPPTVAPITLSLSRNSPVPSPSTAKLPPVSLYGKTDIDSPREDGDTSLRASKRRRVPNKFYGYSSDEEEEKGTPKWRKTEPVIVPQQHSSTMVVPPITIKTTPPVQPFTIRNTTTGQLKIQTPKRLPTIKLKPPKPEEVESEAESNDSSNESRNMLQVDPNALYCYCKCPYDEVSEMIGCDSRDCNIEWFHFECVGIMVPPKGHWYCPECRKKRQQKREMLKLKAKTANA